MGPPSPASKSPPLQPRRYLLGDHCELVLATPGMVKWVSEEEEGSWVTCKASACQLRMRTICSSPPHFWGSLYQPTSSYAYTSSSTPSRARRGRDKDHQGLRVRPSFPAVAGGPLSEDSTSLWGNPHRPQMAPDCSPLPQAVGAGAGAGLGGGWRWRDGWREGLGLERTLGGSRSGWRDWGWCGISMDDESVEKTGEGKVAVVCVMGFSWE